MPGLGVLIGDRDDCARRAMAERFACEGHRVAEAASGERALDLIRDHSFDVALCDFSLVTYDGVAVFRHLRRESPATAVIVTSASPRVEDAVLALKEGVADFIAKPFDFEALLGGPIARVAERQARKSAFDEARAQLVGRIVGAALIGSSPPMRRLLDRLERVARTDTAVLVTGEHGTGKDIVARHVYARSTRAARPFVSVDCTADPSLVEDELFSRARGLDAARGGTLFLDEVGSLPARAQPRLARVIERGIADVRFVSATHDDLRVKVAAGTFRADLFYAIDRVELPVAPLRKRRSDLPALVRHFVERLSPPGNVAPGVSPAAWDALERHAFPGNVRELARAIEHAMALAHGSEIGREHLPAEIAGSAVSGTFEQADPLGPLDAARRRFEREYVARAVSACEGDVARAAILLGIEPSMVQSKLLVDAPASGARLGPAKARPRVGSEPRRARRLR